MPESKAENAAAESATREQVLEATRLAWRWHGGQTRKGRPTSYMSHLLQVQGLVIACGGSHDQSIAALLHDALEDAPSSAERREREAQIGARFDRPVLQIVLDCTDTTTAESGDDKGPWRERKERYLEQLRSAEPVSLLVAACDKRHNLGDLVWDLRHEGAATLARFNAGAEEQVWYYTGVTAICRSAIPSRLDRELDTLVTELRALLDL